VVFGPAILLWCALAAPAAPASAEARAALERAGLPRLAVLVAEQRIDEARPAAWWGEEARAAAPRALAVDQRIAENRLMADWQPLGFDFVDLEALSGRIRVAGIMTSDLTPAQVREVQSLAGCDVVITGSSIATKLEDLSRLLEGISQGAETVTGVSCRATVSLRAANADDGRVLASAEAAQPATHQSLLACGREAIVSATREAGELLRQRLLEAWSRVADEGGRVVLLARGVATPAQAEELRTALAALPGMRAVVLRRLAGGVAELKLAGPASAEKLAGDLDGRRLPRRRAQVTGFTPHTMEITLER
jgi:hypothetical protein